MDRQTAGRTDRRLNGPTEGADGRVDGRPGGSDGLARQGAYADRRTSTACREEVAEVCAVAYSVMPPPGRSARTDSDQVLTVRLAAKPIMTDILKQKLNHIENRFMFACPL
jgi:hypothetical protein